MTVELGEGAIKCPMCEGTLFQYDANAEGSKCLNCGYWISGYFRGMVSV